MSITLESERKKTNNACHSPRSSLSSYPSCVRCDRLMMSTLSEPKREVPLKFKQKDSQDGKANEEKAVSSQGKNDSARIERRKEWWRKKQQSNSVGFKGKGPPDKSDERSDGENPKEKPSEQISKLRNRETIAKPDNLQYEPNMNRGFHAKILHSLYNAPVKKKKDTSRDENTKSRGKRKSNNSTPEKDKKKAKINSAVPAPEPEVFDSYAFSMNLINGEVEKVKAQQNQKGKDSKNKYVLFIGNLPHDITREQLEEHFRKTGGIKAIRIPREKGNDKGRGFAYMEFDSRISHGIALRLHQTTLGGRKINVEFTTIGGGKSVTRREKLRRKNMKCRKMKMQYRN